LSIIGPTPSLPTPADRAEPSSKNVGLKALGGVIGALAIIGLAFFLTAYLLRRKWRRVQGADTRQTLYEATAMEDIDDDGEGGQSGKSHSNTDGNYGSGGLGAAGGGRTSLSGGYTDRPRGERRNSLMGSEFAPGIEVEEPYSLFAGSTVSFQRRADDGDRVRGVDKGKGRAEPLGTGESLNTDQRGNGDGLAVGVDGKPPPSESFSGRSLLGDSSRYPSINPPSPKGRPLSGHPAPGSPDTVADGHVVGSPESGVQRVDPFADLPDTGSRRSSVSNPVIEGKRISLRGGVGVKTRSPKIQPAPGAGTMV